MNWMSRDSHRQWLLAAATDLLGFGRATPVDGGGAAWLDDDGRPRTGQPLHTWIAGRTVHAYSIGHLLGVPGCRPIATAALAGLHGPAAPLRDHAHGGWLTSAPAAGQDHPIPDEKSCYAHAFVMLAGSSAVRAGLPGADELLAEATATFERWFWDEDSGGCLDAWNRDFSALEPYRGINATMHTVEAVLAVADVTGDQVWLDRGRRMGDFLVGSAAAHGWRIPEHYDPQWRPRPDFNRDRPGDKFKPYGSTVGHGLEWSRLLLHLDAALRAAGTDPGPAYGEAAARLYDRAVKDGWASDGAPGFVYTVDWDGTPIVRDRLHWVAAEAIGAAAALYRRTRDDRYAQDYATWWDYAQQYLVDHRLGSWRHQLDPEHRPASTVWAGKPDIYHALQAILTPLVPLTPSMASAIAAGSVGLPG